MNQVRADSIMLDSDANGVILGIWFALRCGMSLYYGSTFAALYRDRTLSVAIHILQESFVCTLLEVCIPGTCTAMGFVCVHGLLPRLTLVLNRRFLGARTS